MRMRKCSNGKRGQLKAWYNKILWVHKERVPTKQKKGKTTKRVKPRKNKGGVYYFQPGDIVLKGNYEVEGYKRGGEVKEFKMSPEELEKYLEKLKIKEVKRRGE